MGIIQSMVYKKKCDAIYDTEIYKYLKIRNFYKAEMSIYKVIWKNYNVNLLYQDSEIIIINTIIRKIAINLFSNISNNHKTKITHNRINNKDKFKIEINISKYDEIMIKELFYQIDKKVKEIIISNIIIIQRAISIYRIKIRATTYIQKKLKLYFIRKRIKSNPVKISSQNIDNWLKHS